MDQLHVSFLDGLLVMGLLFPVIGLITLPLAWWTSRKTGRNCSAILIPFFGPLCLTVWLLASPHSAWFIPCVWMLDPSTVMFLSITPQFFRHTRWNRVALFQGIRGGHSITLSLHSNGDYVLHQSRKRGMTSPPSPSESGEVGQYTTHDDRYELVRGDGLQRALRSAGEDRFELVESPIAPFLNHGELDGFTLTRLS